MESISAEFNVSSNRHTVETGDTVLFRRRGIEDVVHRLRREGHHIEIDWDMGSGYADGFIDVPPYKHVTHLKIKIAQYVVTSIGLIIRKAE